MTAAQADKADAKVRWAVVVDPTPEAVAEAVARFARFPAELLRRPRRNTRMLDERKNRLFRLRGGSAAGRPNEDPGTQISFEGSCPSGWRSWSSPRC